MRRARIWIVVAIAAVALPALLVTLALHAHRRASTKWAEFSIGPATGRSAQMNATSLRSDGITLKAALARAYNIPSVRVFGPASLLETPYSITAVVRPEEAASFAPLLQEELVERLALEVHIDPRPFDVFVLSAMDAPLLPRARAQNAATWVGDQEAKFEAATTERLASGLQLILNRPVVDETGLAGSFDLDLAWEQDRVSAVTAMLRDRFGLRLIPGKRQMDTLIVDEIRRDPSLVLLAHVGRMTHAAPGNMRRWIAQVMTIH